jgi:hypothetical protein
MPISGVFDTLENEETAPRFTRNDDSNTRFKLRYTCAKCEAVIEVAKRKQQHKCVWTVKGDDKVRTAMQRDMQDERASCRHVSNRPVQNTPRVAIAELYTTSKCSEIGVNSTFQLETSINLADSEFTLVSVCYRAPGHYISETLRNVEGTEQWYQIDDVQERGEPTNLEHQTKRIPMPTGESIHGHQRKANAPNYLIYVNKSPTISSDEMGLGQQQGG